MENIENIENNQNNFIQSSFDRLINSYMGVGTATVTNINKENKNNSNNISNNIQVDKDNAYNLIQENFCDIECYEKFQKIIEKLRQNPNLVQQMNINLENTNTDNNQLRDLLTYYYNTGYSSGYYAQQADDTNNINNLNQPK